MPAGNYDWIQLMLNVAPRTAKRAAAQDYILKPALRCLIDNVQAGTISGTVALATLQGNSACLNGYSGSALPFCSCISSMVLGEQKLIVSDWPPPLGCSSTPVKETTTELAESTGPSVMPRFIVEEEDPALLPHAVSSGTG